jgi:hypothetical protein
MLDIELIRTNLLPFAAPTISLVAFFLSLASFATSRRTLRLAEEKDSRTLPKINIECRLASISRNPSRKIREFIVRVDAVNLSDSANSVRSVDLRIFTKSPVGQEVSFRIPSAETPTISDKDNLSPYAVLPAKVESHGAVSFWISFLVRDALLEGAIITSYEAVVTDTHGVEVIGNISFVSQTKIVDEVK